MTEKQQLQLPNNVSPEIPLDLPILQFDEEGIILLASTYFNELPAAEDPTHKKHERALGVIEVDELVLGMMGLEIVLNEVQYTPDMVARPLSEYQVRQLIILHNQVWEEHRSNPNNERLTRRATELHIILRELGQYSYDTT